MAADAAEPVEDNLISVPLSPLQATTAVAETTVVAYIRSLTVFSAIDVVPCTGNDKYTHSKGRNNTSGKSHIIWYFFPRTK